VIDMNDCRAQLQRYTPGTCEWILSNTQFRQWISDDKSSLLQIAGGMGTGKSILMSYLVDNIQAAHLDAVTCRTPQKVTVCSFFCDDKNIARKNGQAILRGLLSQILHQRHDLLGHATSRISPIEPVRWSLLVLWEILESIMLNPITGTVVFVLDAMDECEPDSRSRVLRSIRQFLTQGSHPSSNCIKFLISSRPNVEIMEEIGRCSKLISFDSEYQKLERALLLVVKEQLDELAINGHWTTEIREDLERRIVSKAEGNFLWVRLVLQRLKKGRQNKKVFYQVLDESPKDLDGMYCRILADIETENQECAAQILRILVGVLRPITTMELRLALAIGLHHRTLESVEDESETAIERTVRVTLGSLVRIHGHTVHLVHQSAKDFLLRLPTGKVANLKAFEPDLQTLYGINLQAANLELATACVAFLALADFENNRILDENVSAFDELPGAT
jgi:ankyrin repeat domain-containing protein 50